MNKKLVRETLDKDLELYVLDHICNALNRRNTSLLKKKTSRDFNLERQPSMEILIVCMSIYDYGLKWSHKSNITLLFFICIFY